MKEFNYTGTCVPEKHYMVDTTNKINEMINLIEKGRYFTINRPRQYGKTTSIALIERKLKDKLLIIKISFQGKESECFSSVENIAVMFLESINIYFRKTNQERYVIEYTDVNSFMKLSELISKFVNEVNKKVVLFIDEVDESTNYEIFSKFLGMLRDKYLKRNEGEDSTFHSIVLVGVHDVKNLKKKIRGDGEISYNSPWNIAIDFKIDMSFSASEISTMLVDYEKDNNTGMDIKDMSEKLYEYTSGYPYLVSKLCYTMDEELEKNFSENGVENAVKIILNENNTLFDDLIKNINRYKELYSLVERIVLEGEEITYNVHAHNMSIMYGITREDKKHKLKINNKIFEIVLYNYMIARREIEKGSPYNYKYSGKFVENGKLNMKLVLEKFQELMKAEYREIDEKFVEREGRLLFLAFMKPIINGVGFYFVEPETRHSNRMDVVVTYGGEKFVIELKIWRGGKYEQEGREQLCEYLEAQNLTKGYMLFYNFNKGKEYKIDRMEVSGKEIFEVLV